MCGSVSNDKKNTNLKGEHADRIGSSSQLPVPVPSVQQNLSSETETSPSSIDDFRPSRTGEWHQRLLSSPPDMSQLIPRLLDNNRRWAHRMTLSKPTFFTDLAKQQRPRILWIGCSDSRVPANEIIDLAPGEVFVHRNVANIFMHCDFNALTVLQYAIDVLKIEEIIVCGHYGCGGVAASLKHNNMEITDNWLYHIKAIYMLHKEKLERIKENEGEKMMHERLCELNIARSVRNVCSTTVIQNAWKRGQKVSVRGWVYSLSDGLLRDLSIVVTGSQEYISLIDEFA